MSPAACTICCVWGVFRTESYQATLTPRSWVSTLRTTWAGIHAHRRQQLPPFQPLDCRGAPPFRESNSRPKRPLRLPTLRTRSSDSSCCQATCKKEGPPGEAQTVRPGHEGLPGQNLPWLRCVNFGDVRLPDPATARSRLASTTRQSANDLRRVKDRRKARSRSSSRIGPANFKTTWSSNAQNTPHPTNRDSMRSHFCFSDHFVTRLVGPQRVPAIPSRTNTCVGHAYVAFLAIEVFAEICTGRMVLVCSSMCFHSLRPWHRSVRHRTGFRRPVCDADHFGAGPRGQNGLVEARVAFDQHGHLT